MPLATRITLLATAVATEFKTRAQFQQMKSPVRTMATNDITLSGLQTVSGVALAAGDRVLASRQTNAAQNGIYIASSGAWTRAADADTIEKLLGAYTYVAEGTWASVQIRTKVKRSDVLGTTAMSWVWTLDDGLYDLGNGVPRLDANGKVKAAQIGAATRPPGEITIYGGFGATPPAGWLWCKGGTFESTQYPDLAAVVQDYFGTHVGTTYYLPDFRGRMPVGIGMASSGSIGNDYQPGQKFGHEGLQSHTHEVRANVGDVAQGAGNLDDFPGSSGPISATNQVVGHTNTPAGAGNAQNIPPVLGVNFIIKT